MVTNMGAALFISDMGDVTSGSHAPINMIPLPNSATSSTDRRCSRIRYIEWDVHHVHHPVLWQQRHHQKPQEYIALLRFMVVAQVIRYRVECMKEHPILCLSTDRLYISAFNDGNNVIKHC